MKTTILLERFNREGLLLERKYQPSRSFLKGLIDLLYVQHGALGGYNMGARYTNGFNIDQAGINMGIYDGSGSLYNQGPNHLLRVASPGGGSEIWPTQSQNNSGPIASLPSELIGIVVGLGNSLVTPTDMRLGQIIGHGVRSPDGSPVLFEHYNPNVTSLLTQDAPSGQNNAVVTSIAGLDVGAGITISDSQHSETKRISTINAGNILQFDSNLSYSYTVANGAKVVYADNNDVSINGNNWQGQPFTPTVTHRITSVSLKIYRNGTPGDLTVRIRGMGDWNDTYQYSSDLAIGTITQANIPIGSANAAYVTCTFPTFADLYAGRRYAIIVSCIGSEVRWRLLNIYQPVYNRAFYSSDAGPRNLYSNNGGASFGSNSSQCNMFAEYGQSSGELMHGGCEVYGLTFTNPSGQFTIRRYFTNNCGTALTVQETGIQAVTGHDDGQRFPILIAHDLVSPGVTVNNGEILAVTYIPQITV